MLLPDNKQNAHERSVIGNDVTGNARVIQTFFSRETDMANKQLALQVICALICSEKAKKKNKRRIWRRECFKRREQQVLSVPLRVLEVNK